jgi:hypothetical protein
VHLRHVLNRELSDIRFFVHGVINHNGYILDTELPDLSNILQALILHRLYILDRHVFLATVQDSLACLEEKVGKFDVVAA